MTTLRPAAIVTLCAAFYAVGNAQRQPVRIHNGFVSGQQYIDVIAGQLPAKFYAAGLVEGMFMAPLFGAPERELDWIEQCVEGMTDAQLAAILTRFLEESPERWHQGAHTAMYAALLKKCPRQQADAPSFSVDAQEALR